MVSCKVAALVALELDVLESVLLAEELAADTELSERAVTADHFLLGDLLSNTLPLAVSVATEEGVAAAGALVVESLVEGNLLSLGLVAGVLELRDVVVLHVLNGVSDDVLLEGENLSHLLVELTYVLGISDVPGASRALQEVKVDILGGPASSDEHAEAVSVENVTATDLDAGLLNVLDHLESATFLAVAVDLLCNEVVSTDEAEAADLRLLKRSGITGNTDAARFLGKLEWLAVSERLNLKPLYCKGHLPQGFLGLVGTLLVEGSDFHE